MGNARDQDWIDRDGYPSPSTRNAAAADTETLPQFGDELVRVSLIDRLLEVVPAP
jgi:hypothetical protein